MAKSYTVDGLTKLENMFVPEVVGPEIINKLVDDIKFAPFAKINYTLKGVPGDTVTRWFYTYIGDAVEFTEGNSISYGELSQDTKQVEIKKAGRGVELTDEAMLYSVGDPEAEAVRQIRVAIAQKIDNDCKAALDGIGSTMTVGDGSKKIGAELVQDALIKYGEDIDGPKALLIAPAQAKDIRSDANFIPASEVKAEMMMNGSLGQILGADIIISNKVVATGEDGSKKYNNYLLKGTPLTIEIKREVMPERDRDIDRKLTKVNADVHYAVYLENEADAVKVVSAE